MWDTHTPNWGPAPAGWRGPRPRPALPYAFGAWAGAFIVLAVLGAANEIADGIGPIIGGSIVLVLAGLLVTAMGVRGPVESAAGTVLAVAVAVLTVLAIVGDEHPPSTSDIKIVLAILTVGYVVLSLIGPVRGRGLFLGLGLLTLVGLVAVLVSDDNVLGGTTRTPFGRIPTAGSAVDTTVTIAIAIVGVAYLIACIALDRSGHSGAGTPFVLVGLFAAIGGAVALGADLGDGDAFVTGLATVLAGVAVGIVGGIADRRASTWIGALTAAIGLLVIVGDLAGDNQWATVGLSAGAAVLLLGAATLLPGGRPRPGPRGTVAAPVVPGVGSGPEAATPPAPPGPPASVDAPAPTDAPTVPSLGPTPGAPGPADAPLSWESPAPSTGAGPDDDRPTEVQPPPAP